MSEEGAPPEHGDGDHPGEPVTLDDVELPEEPESAGKIAETEPRYLVQGADRFSDYQWPDAEQELESIERDQKKENLEGQRQDRKQRKDFATKIFRLVCAWLAGMFLLLLLQGLGHLGGTPFFLSNGVLVAAIGGTTVNVIGIFFVVAQYLFPNQGARTWRRD